MLTIEYVPIEQIKMYEKNAKLHPEEQIEQIKKSIQEFGFNDPIALWHGEIVEGHGRYLAAKELGMTELPVIRLDDLTDEQRRAYMLAHNKLTMNSDFDIDILNEELGNIFEFNMGDFGFEFFNDNDNSSEDENNNETQNGSEEKNYAIVYEIAFNNEEEQQEWFDILKQLKLKYPDVETISERILFAFREWNYGD